MIAGCGCHLCGAEDLQVTAGVSAMSCGPMQREDSAFATALHAACTPWPRVRAQFRDETVPPNVGPGLSTLVWLFKISQAYPLPVCAQAT